MFPPLNPRQVFINCPFDESYTPLFKAMVFTCIKLGFQPAIAETKNSAVNRLIVIRDLIRDSALSIHDLSRCFPALDTSYVASIKPFMLVGKAPNLEEINNITSRYLRFNMPFELGLDLGSQYYDANHGGTKKCLVVAGVPDFYKQVLSDFSGHDIGVHQNDVCELIEIIQVWLSTIDSHSSQLYAEDVYYEFIQFREFEYRESGQRLRNTIKSPFKYPGGVSAYLDSIGRWLTKN